MASLMIELSSSPNKTGGDDYLNCSLTGVQVKRFVRPPAGSPADAKSTLEIIGNAIVSLDAADAKTLIDAGIPYVWRKDRSEAKDALMALKPTDA